MDPFIGATDRQCGLTGSEDCKLSAIMHNFDLNFNPVLY